MSRAQSLSKIDNESPLFCPPPLKGSLWLNIPLNTVELQFDVRFAVFFCFLFFTRIVLPFF